MRGGGPRGEGGHYKITLVLVQVLLYNILFGCFVVACSDKLPRAAAEVGVLQLERAAPLANKSLLLLAP